MSVTWQAPGRVNLIGEHTDYNAGFALPFAIDRSCVASVETIAGGELVMTSAQRPEPVVVPVGRLVPQTLGWAGYVAGVVAALSTRGVDIAGLRIAIDSTVPAGAGLASSAALTCATAAAIDDVLGLGLRAEELLAVTRSAENDFVGAPTGGMDQLAALRCTADGALLCDMRSLQTESIPFGLAAAGLVLLVVDTNAAHRHSDGAYRARREGCEAAAARLGVVSLREIPAGELAAATARLPTDELRRYLRHVVTENERVLRTAELMRAGQLAEIGPLLTASHVSLRDDYRVTIPELDVAVEVLLRSGAHGARMTGGGFGGSVIGLIDATRAEAAVTAVTAEFARRGFARPTHFVGRPSRGTHRLAPA